MQMQGGPPQPTERGRRGSTAVFQRRSVPSRPQGELSAQTAICIDFGLAYRQRRLSHNAARSESLTVLLRGAEAESTKGALVHIAHLNGPFAYHRWRKPGVGVA